jgi:hypothetical protein
MSNARRDPSMFRDLVVEPQPLPCTECGASVRLVCIEPAKPGFDLRTFKCSKCDNVDQYVVAYGTAAPWVTVDSGLRTLPAPPLPGCPKCGYRMSRVPSPLNRIFCDVRTFECSRCAHTLLQKYPLDPMQFDETTLIELPRCAKCQKPMMVARLSSGPTGFDLQCPKCDRIETVAVALETMKSKFTGWMRHLHSPK